MQCQCFPRKRTKFSTFCSRFFGMLFIMLSYIESSHFLSLLQRIDAAAVRIIPHRLPVCKAAAVAPPTLARRHLTVEPAAVRPWKGAWMTWKGISVSASCVTATISRHVDDEECLSKHGIYLCTASWLQGCTQTGTGCFSAHS